MQEMVVRLAERAVYDFSDVAADGVVQVPWVTRIDVSQYRHAMLQVKLFAREVETPPGTANIQFRCYNDGTEDFVSMVDIDNTLGAIVISANSTPTIHTVELDNTLMASPHRALRGRGAGEPRRRAERRVRGRPGPAEGLSVAVKPRRRFRQVRPGSRHASTVSLRPALLA